MYIEDKSHIECMEKDLVYIDELMLRWPYLCYLKICDEVINRKLPVYIATSPHINIKGEPTNIIIKFDMKHFDFDIMQNHFQSLAFLTKDVKKIEAKKSYRSLPAKYLTDAEHSFCTVKNINKIAPQLLYALCSNKNKKFEASAIRFDMSSTAFDPMVTRMSGVKSDLIFTAKQIKGRCITRRPTVKEEEKNEWMARATTFIQCKREQGITNRNDLATLIDEFFPYHFSNHDLGLLFSTKKRRQTNPQKEKEIKYESIQKRGQRLRKVK